MSCACGSRCECVFGDGCGLAVAVCLGVCGNLNVNLCVGMGLRVASALPI